jgi:hypothetical protein
MTDLLKNFPTALTAANIKQWQAFLISKACLEVNRMATMTKTQVYTECYTCFGRHIDLSLSASSNFLHPYLPLAITKEILMSIQFIPLLKKVNSRKNKVLLTYYYL